MLVHAAMSVVSATLVGMIWYSPLLFGSTWMRLQYPGKKPEEIAGGSAAILVSCVGNGIVATGVFTMLRVFLKVDGLESCLQAAACISAIVCSSQICHMAFERKPLALFFINHGYDVVCIFMSTAILNYLG